MDSRQSSKTLETVFAQLSRINLINLITWVAPVRKICSSVQCQIVRRTIRSLWMTPFVIFVWVKHGETMQNANPFATGASCEKMKVFPIPPRNLRNPTTESCLAASGYSVARQAYLKTEIGRCGCHGHFLYNKSWKSSAPFVALAGTST